jgi:hypothetical protein
VRAARPRVAAPASVTLPNVAGRQAKAGTAYLIFRATSTPALKFVSKFGWLLIHS